MVTLRLHDQAGVVSELCEGTVNSGFRELGSYLFSASVDGASLFIDEAPADPVWIDIDGVQGWQWKPGFYAGQVVAELVSGAGQLLAEYRIDVSPDPSKLGADVFNEMLDDLYAFDPTLLLGTEAAQTSIGVSGDVVSPLLAYARLRRHAADLLKAMQTVTKEPLKKLRRERTLVPYHRVRRLDAASTRRMLRRPGTAAFLHNNGILDERNIPLLEVARSTDDLDNPANRALTATLLAVRRRCVQVADALKGMANKETDETRTPLKPRLARKLEFLTGLAEKLAKLSRLEPYASVSRAEVTANGLTAISAHPSYARAYRFGWSVLRSGVAGEARDESLWLSPTWEIYERWCFTRVAACLRERFGGLTWRMDQWGVRKDCIRLIGVGSSMRIEASLQTTFRSGGGSSNGLRSVSLELKPDLLITMLSDGEQRMLVLDAKYRTSRQNVLDAMRSAHLYHDALRWNGERADCSLLLVPRGGGVPWLEDPNFHATHRVGVHVLAPDSLSSGLHALLERWLTPDVRALL